jgi:hypothetical protein
MDGMHGMRGMQMTRRGRMGKAHAHTGRRAFGRQRAVLNHTGRRRCGMDDSCFARSHARCHSGSLATRTCALQRARSQQGNTRCRQSALTTPRACGNRVCSPSVSVQLTWPRAVRRAQVDCDVVHLWKKCGFRTWCGNNPPRHARVRAQSRCCNVALLVCARCPHPCRIRINPRLCLQRA